MNPIDRIGMKVVCIQEIEIETPRCDVYKGPTPVLDAVYTVTGFGDCGMLLADAPDDDIDAGIFLAELPSIDGRRKRDGKWVTLAWPIMIFRPVDERKTDISDLVRLGEHALEPA